MSRGNRDDRNLANFWTHICFLSIPIYGAIPHEINSPVMLCTASNETKEHTNVYFINWMLVISKKALQFHVFVETLRHCLSEI